MNNTIRRNVICIIGLPRCDFVFSSTRTCFIAYGFEESTLEMAVIRNLLEKKGILAVEAGGALAPAQNAFCAKICSKIITSQFCIVLINNNEDGGQEIPNANVNMEYGLMLGFNKYVIPFQRESQRLPFNVAGLDTIKYSQMNIERLASDAIDQAIDATKQDPTTSINPDQLLNLFFLTKKTIMNPLTAEGDRQIFEIGNQLGFNLLNDFSGFKYIFLGNFTALRPETVIWRLKTLKQIISERRLSLNERVKFGLVTPEQRDLAEKFFGDINIWIILTSNDEKKTIKSALSSTSLDDSVECYSLDDVRAELETQF